MEFTRNDGVTGRFAEDMNLDAWRETDKSAKSNNKYYEDWIDNLDFDMGKFTSTMKNALKAMMGITITVGKIVLRVGKIMLDILMRLMREFPNTIMGVAIGFFFGALCSAIPFLGWALAPALTPLFMLGGGLMGFFTDCSSKFAASGMEISFRKSIREEMANLGVANV
jgi:hypothetical protein